MEIEVIERLITGIGFPICCCGAMMWFYWQHDKEDRVTLAHMREAIEQNTTVIAELNTLVKLLWTVINDNNATD